MTKTAWLFPGQGSQHPEMMADLLTAYPPAKERCQQAAAILGWSVIDCCAGCIGNLDQTLYTQPSLFLVESLLVDALKERGAKADFVAGHSLGEYVALYAAEVFDFETGLKLVQRRAALMNAAGGGKMVALIGFDRQELQQAIASTPNVVLANDNHPGQVVISGLPEAVEALLAKIKVKRAVPLNVSGAFHSPFMATAAATFATLLDECQFQAAVFPVLNNVEPEPTTDAALIKARLRSQMTGSVRWVDTCHALAAAGVTQALEIGPGNVLAGLVKRTTPEINVRGVATIASLESLV
ncbi:MAG TPA: ACP S-malonyltransferase [Thermosynechococcus sp. M3746_W2019_013]|uniref:ACP S-malonyltransferase n=1 Tax=Thermosynechococcus sp. M3746_W2019_013 TaxID=2747806 RepID=UPI0019F03C31|nr:ACP S-malonyltransferase [Thermosynechococcus sp. M3746_W2019_013]HIK22258.1 ACP S-malonyltransferase [Thermosynechococcus sp. M3746_W2019_013]